MDNEICKTEIFSVSRYKLHPAHRDNIFITLKLKFLEKYIYIFLYYSNFCTTANIQLWVSISCSQMLANLTKHDLIILIRWLLIQINGTHRTHFDYPTFNY